jgi:hypothetical protein
MSSYRLDRVLLVIASFAEEEGRQVAGRDSGFCVTITHRATHRLLCHHPATVLSGSRPEWLLAVPYSENGPQEDTFRNHGGHQINATAERQWIPKEAFRRCFQLWQDRWSKCVCVCVCVCVCERESNISTLKAIWWEFPCVLPLQCNTTFPRTFWLPIVCQQTNKSKNCRHSDTESTIELSSRPL